MWYTLLMILTISPLILGIAWFGGNYLKEEFYKHPFYEEEE